MKNKSFVIVFLLLFFVGSFLRFYQLGNVPGSMDWDEVSFGYNAYSVLHTGKDEYGVSYPLLFRAFGEYKQPVFAYLDVFSIGLFGLNAFAVRFPSAFFGSLSILFVYLLTFELFKKYPFAKKLSLLTMFFYAISPWSIQFSRIAFEANVALSFLIIGIWMFLRGLSIKNRWYLFGSAIFFGLSQLTYISLKLIGPLLFISLIIYGFSFLKKQKTIFGIILLLYILISGVGFLDSHSLTRGQDVLFTNQQTQLLRSSIGHLQFSKEHNDVLGEIIYNRRVIYAEKFFENYFSHFNPYWLFLKGDSVLRHHAPGMGNLYIVSASFILLGIYFLLTRYFSVSWILFVWFLIAPLASSLSSDAPSSLRSLIFLPTWQIFEAAGIIYFFQIIKPKKVVWILQIVILCLYAVNFYYYMHEYYTYTNSYVEFEKAWQYGYKEAAVFADQNSNKRIFFSDNFEQPYIFYLFYTQTNPATYQRSGGSNRITTSCFTINNAFFGICKDKLKKGDYYITLNGQQILNVNKIKEISYFNGNPAITVYQLQ